MKPFEITSRANPRFKALRGLARAGFDADHIAVEGEKLIREALRAGLVPESIWSHVDHPFQEPCHHYRIPAQMYGTVSPTKTGNAPLAVFPAPRMRSFHQTQGRYLFLDRVQEPGNAGALVRGAVAFGFDGVIWNKPCVYPFHHACIRASAGNIFHIANYLFDPDLAPVPPIYGTDAGGDYRLGAFPWPKDLILAMGNEGHGLCDEVRDLLTATVGIPTSGKVESLNVSGAAHVVMYQIQESLKADASPHGTPRQT